MKNRAAVLENGANACNVVMVICETAWLTWLNAVSIDSTHHRRSLIASGDTGTWGYQSYLCTGVGPGFLQFQSIGNGGARTLLPENWKLVAPTLELLSTSC